MAHIDPTREAFRAFAMRPLEGPIHMLNLIRLRERAAYEDGRELSGAQAYEAYGREAAPFFAAQGGQIVWRGRPFFPVVGPADEAWDLGFIAEYPSKAAFLAMVKDPGYQAIVFHRQAAVADSRLFAFAAGSFPGEGAQGSGVFG